jgi:hypothetical protein
MRSIERGRAHVVTLRRTAGRPGFTNSLGPAAGPACTEGPRSRPETGATATERQHIVPQVRDTKECAVTPEATTQEKPADPPARSTRSDQLGSLEVWARSAPIRLAGYEDDLAEPHILPSVD